LHLTLNNPKPFKFCRILWTSIFQVFLWFVFPNFHSHLMFWFHNKKSEQSFLWRVIAWNEASKPIPSSTNIYSTSSTRWSFFLILLPNLARHVPYYLIYKTYLLLVIPWHLQHMYVKLLINLEILILANKIYQRFNIFLHHFHFLWKKKFENFNIFESNRMIVEAPKVLWYALKILGAIP
jgi:hypothetical protein